MPFSVTAAHLHGDLRNAFTNLRQPLPDLLRTLHRFTYLFGPGSPITIRPRLPTMPFSVTAAHLHGDLRNAFTNLRGGGIPFRGLRHGESQLALEGERQGIVRGQLGQRRQGNRQERRENQVREQSFHDAGYETGMSGQWLRAGRISRFHDWRVLRRSVRSSFPDRNVGLPPIFWSPS